MLWSHGQQAVTLADAFDKPTAHFDHGDLYGGKFPCAVHAPGPGNSANRRNVGDMGAKPKTDAERLKYLNMTLHPNHRFIVPRREVTLFIHWIESHTVDLNSSRPMRSDSSFGSA